MSLWIILGVAAFFLVVIAVVPTGWRSVWAHSLQGTAALVAMLVDAWGVMDWTKILSPHDAALLGAALATGNVIMRFMTKGPVPTTVA